MNKSKLGKNLTLLGQVIGVSFGIMTICRIIPPNGIILWSALIIAIALIFIGKYISN